MSRSPRTAVAKTATRPSPPSYAELEARLAVLTAELHEAREQQTATAEVLQVINSSPGDLSPVFDAILERAHTLCEATYGSLLLRADETFRARATHGYPQALAERFRQGLRPGANHPIQRLVEGDGFAHVADLGETDDPTTRSVVQLAGVRTSLFVALRKDGALLGAITAGRVEVRPFSEKQIALLQNFAAQAVIAMENARLLTETREALEQQTATAEVLQVINSSPGNLAPVFDAMLEKALLLCEVDIGTLWIYDGKMVHAAAVRGASRQLTEFLAKGPHPPARPQLRVLSGVEPLMQIPDITKTEAYRDGDPIPRAIADLGGVRTLLIVPLRKDDAVLGNFAIYRREPRHFTDKQIGLLQNFAAQAVIAMENARLLGELRERTHDLEESLEYQTATSDVLQVISRSTLDLQPVLDTLVQTAGRLCTADSAYIAPRDGEAYRVAAAFGLQSAFETFARELPMMPSRDWIGGRTILERRVVHVADVARDPEHAHPEAVNLGRLRTVLGVPLLREGEPIGVLVLHRHRVEPFTERQIELVRTFADQAVIAIENSRLITETREALEQQTATAEVLQVINSSPGDLAPVFDAMLEKAMRLCEAAFGQLGIYDGGRFLTAAIRGVPAAFAEYRRSNPPNYGPGTTPFRILAGERVIRSDDLKAEPVYQSGDPNRRAIVDLGGARSNLAVALRKDNEVLGFIQIYRQEVRPFTEKQIALLQNFAAQAVIAMENARLLTETREALEQQTATDEVLQVINSSPGDLTPVFDAILEKAHALCGASHGALVTYDGEHFRAVATHELPAPFADLLRQPFRPEPGWPQDQLLRGERLVHMPDASILHGPAWDSPRARAAREAGLRALLMLPLRKDSRLLGYISANRLERGPFSEKQIALLQNFAAQAVIAMENARLLTETREALEQQTATAEVLQVINSSPGDLAPVFDAILDKALHLCEANFGTFWKRDGDRFYPGALRGVPPAFAKYMRREPLLPAPNSGLGRAAGGEPCVHIADIADSEAYRVGDPQRRALVDLGGARTAVWVPLRKDDAVLGVFTIYRQEVRPFTDNQIALLQNFAAQAVIAMDNARLITETREALEQQTATAEILRVISGSPTDVQPTFDAIAANATTLSGAAAGMVFRFDGSLIHFVASRGLPPDLLQAMQHSFPSPPDRRSTTTRAIQTREIVHIADVAADPEFALPAIVQTGWHTALAVPILQDGNPVGAITVVRREVAPFLQAQIDLLKTFADQAVIAIENVRLFNELNARTRDLEESLEYQTATSDVLQVISRSTFDLQPVLDTLVETAARLCDADQGVVWRSDGEFMSCAAAFGDARDAVMLLGGREINRGTLGGRAILERRPVHVTDAAADPDSAIHEAVAVAKSRSGLSVPLLREGDPIGAITLARQRVEPFTERQIQLVRTFADQAVIAIENTRLLTELRESLEQQQAIAEVLRVINSSPGDLAPVFDAILEKAHSLCGIAQGSLELYDGERFRAVAVRGLSDTFADMLRRGYPAPDNPATGPLLEGSRFTHIRDLSETQYRITRSGAELEAARTLLCIPLRRDETLLGMIASARREVRPFSEKEIALLENFAAQAVIAMDNARLLNEIRQRQAELRVTFDNMGDGVAMFDGELRLAAWNLNFQRILDLPDALLAEPPRIADFVRYLAKHGEYGAVDVEAEVRRLSESAGTQWSTERTRPDGQVIEVRNNPVPGGGSVLIYSDITERKRAEAEIRAARDAAEKALGELQTAQASLVHAQKMAALGQLTAGIAHEIKNPLNFVNNFAELSGELLLELKETTAPMAAALDSATRAEVDEIVDMLRGNLDKIAEHGKRADGIVKSMLEHSRGVSGERRVVDLNALIEEALNLAYHGARAQDARFNITLEREFDRGLAPIDLAPQEMTRVFLNLFGNGFYAASRRQRDGSGPDYRPTLTVTTRDFGEAVEVRVQDNGTGIAPEIRDKLFQPFVTTKPTGQGTGRGLSIAYDIVTQQHGGTIAVDSVPGEFTEFTIRLPRARQPITAAEAAG